MTRSPTILFPYAGAAIGGHVYSSFLLVEGLLGRGLDVRVGLHGDGPVSQEARRRGLPCIDLPVLDAPGDDPRLDRFQMSSVLATPLLLRALSASAVRWVHVNDKRMLRVWSPAALLSGCGLVAHWRSVYARSITIDAALRRARRIIAVSDYSRAGLPEGLRAKCDVVLNPFKPPADPAASEAAGCALRAKLAIPQDAFVVGQFGNLTVRKRPHMLVDLVAALGDQSGRRPVFGLLCGAPGHPPDPLLDQRLNARPGIAERIVRTGHVAPIDPYMAACDVIIQPAVREPLARVGVEAQSLGRPVIAGSDGGLKEVIRDGVDGFILSPDDFDAWVKTLQGLADSPERAAAMGEAGRAAAASLTLERHLDGVLGCYKRAGYPYTAL